MATRKSVLEFVNRMINESRHVLDRMSMTWPYGKHSTGSELWADHAIAASLGSTYVCYPQVTCGRGRIDVLAVQGASGDAIAFESKIFGTKGPTKRVLKSIKRQARRLLRYKCKALDKSNKLVTIRVRAAVVYVLNWNHDEFSITRWRSRVAKLNGYRALRPIQVYTDKKLQEQLSILAAVAIPKSP